MPTILLPRRNSILHHLPTFIIPTMPSTEKTTKISSDPGRGRRTGTAAQRKQALEAERRLREQREAESKQRTQASGSKQLSTPPPAPRDDRSTGRLAKASRQGGTPMKEDQAALVDGDQKPSAVSDPPPDKEEVEEVEIPEMDVDADIEATATTEGKADAEMAPPSAPSKGTTKEGDDVPSDPPHTPDAVPGEATTTPGVTLKSAMSRRGRSRSVEARSKKGVNFEQPPPPAKTTTKPRSRSRSRSAPRRGMAASADSVAGKAADQSTGKPARKPRSRSRSATRRDGGGSAARRGGASTAEPTIVETASEDDEGGNDTGEQGTWSKVTSKKRKGRGGKALGKSATIPQKAPPEFSSSAFLEVSIFLDSGLDKDVVFDMWVEAVADLLSRFRAMPDGASAICILHPTDDTLRIYDREDFPEFFVQWSKFASFENNNVLSMPTPDDRSRKIVSTLRFGFHTDPEEFISMSRIDMSKVKNVMVFYKPLQEFDTERDIYLMYSATKVPMQSIADKLRKFLPACERKFVLKYPNDFRAEEHSGPFPPIDVRIDWARGGTFNQRPQGAKDEDTSHRKVPTIFYPRADRERIVRVVQKIKEKGLTAREFGDHSFFQIQLPPKVDAAEKTRFDEKIRNHGAAQLSMGNATIPGLVNPDYPVTVELYPDGDGPRQSPGEMSVMQILQKIRAPKPSKFSLFQGIYQGYGGVWIAFFSGQHPDVEEMATSWCQDLAATLRFYLQRQGWKLETIRQLIRKSFTEMAADSASRAKYDKKTGKIVSGAAIQHAAHNAALDKSFINRNLGLTSWEKEEIAQKEAEERESAVTRSKFGPESMGGFDFGDGDRSEKTKYSSRTAATHKTFQFDTQSKFDIDSGVDLDDGAASGGDITSDEDMGMDDNVYFEVDSTAGSDVSFGGKDDESDIFSPSKPGAPFPTSPIVGKRLETRFGGDEMEEDGGGEDVPQGGASQGGTAAGGSQGEQFAGTSGQSGQTSAQMAQILEQMSAMQAEFAVMRSTLTQTEEENARLREQLATGTGKDVPPDKGNGEEAADTKASPGNSSSAPQQETGDAANSAVGTTTAGAEAQDGDGGVPPPPP